MSHLTWIVCERDGHWSAALRTAIRRDWWPEKPTPRLIEIRQLTEMASYLAEQPHSIALIEVNAGNLGSVLDWLGNAHYARREARFVALVSRDFAAHCGDDHTKCREIAEQVTDVLREAGASDVVLSPRRIAPVLAWGKTYVAVHEAAATKSPELATLAEAAWAALPWQDG